MHACAQVLGNIHETLETACSIFRDQASLGPLRMPRGRCSASESRQDATCVAPILSSQSFGWRVSLIQVQHCSYVRREVSVLPSHLLTDGSDTLSRAPSFRILRDVNDPCLSRADVSRNFDAPAAQQVAHWPRHGPRRLNLLPNKRPCRANAAQLGQH